MLAGKPKSAGVFGINEGPQATISSIAPCLDKKSNPSALPALATKGVLLLSKQPAAIPGNFEIINNIDTKIHTSLGVLVVHPKKETLDIGVFPFKLG